MARRFTLGPVAALWLGSFLLLPAPAAAEKRLGTDVVPVSQDIRLRLDPRAADYRGTVHIALEVRRPTASFDLHARDMTLDRVTLEQKGRPLAVRHASGDHGLLTLTADVPIAAGPAVLEIDFHQKFNTQAVSLYRMEAEGRAYVFSQFEADDARGAFPCFDEPIFKIPFRMTVEIPDSDQVIFNSPVAAESARDGWKTVTFKPMPPTSTYLLALAAGPLESVPIPGLSVPGRIVTVRGQGALSGLAAEMAPGILKACEAYFGRPYPYEKLDLIAVPEYWAGAMENPGAITYADNALLIDPAAASPQQRRTLARYTAHEFAHMWFGDLVTMAWWDDLWLNESFADWMGDKITDQLYPGYEVGLNELQNVQAIMATDARPSTNPIRRKVETASTALDEVALDYNKGKAVLSMFETWIGPETFRRGVNDYLKANEWKNAKASDLWQALSKVSGRDLTGAMEGFIAQPGLPLVRVEPLGGNRVRLTQRRFANDRVTVAPMRWQIPIGLKYSDGRRVGTTQVLLRDSAQVVAVPGADRLQWVMPNLAARGYYRWSVPGDMLMEIARAPAGMLDAPERIALLGNCAALLDAGELPGDTYLQLLARFGDDAEPQVVSSVIAGLSKARQAFVPDALRDRFAPYVREVLGPAARRFGIERRDGEREAVAIVRPQLMSWLGLWGNDEVTLDASSRLARSYLDAPASVDPAIAGTVLQLAARRGDRALFERYMSALESTRVPAGRQRLLGALGRFDDPAIEQDVLAFALKVRPNELFAVVSGLGAKSDRSAERAFAWTRDHYEEVKARLPVALLPFLVNAANGCSLDKLEVGRNFFLDPARKVEGTEREFAQVSDAVHDCVRLREREGSRVAAYLDSRVGSR